MVSGNGKKIEELKGNPGSRQLKAPTQKWRHYSSCICGTISHPPRDLCSCLQLTTPGSGLLRLHHPPCESSLIHTAENWAQKGWCLDWAAARANMRCGIQPAGPQTHGAAGSVAFQGFHSPDLRCCLKIRQDEAGGSAWWSQSCLVALMSWSPSLGFTLGLCFAGRVGQEGSVSPLCTRALPALPGRQAWQLQPSASCKDAQLCLGNQGTRNN